MRPKPTEHPRAARPKRTHIASVLAACITLLAGGCADTSKSPSANAPIRVASTDISRATIAHWTRALASDDFHAITGQTIPPGLLNDPPNDARCVTALIAYLTTQSPHALNTNRTKLTQDCHELWLATRTAAINMLTTTIWQENELKKAHITITPTQANNALTEEQKSRYPQPGELTRTLQARGWTTTDETYSLRTNLLATHLIALWKTHTTNENLAPLAFNYEQRWKALTTCQPEYITEHCNQYNPHKPPTTRTIAVILEEITSHAEP